MLLALQSGFIVCKMSISSQRLLACYLDMSTKKKKKNQPHLKSKMDVNLSHFQTGCDDTTCFYNARWYSDSVIDSGTHIFPQTKKSLVSQSCVTIKWQLPWLHHIRSQSWTKFRESNALWCGVLWTQHPTADFFFFFFFGVVRWITFVSCHIKRGEWVSKSK